MFRKLIRTAPAALLAAALFAVPAAAGNGHPTAWPTRLVDLLFAWLPDASRTGNAASERTVLSFAPPEAGDVPDAGSPAPDGETQSYGGESSEGEVAPSLDPNG